MFKNNNSQAKSTDSSDIEITIEMKSKDEILKNYLKPDKNRSLLKMVIKSLETKFSKVSSNSSNKSKISVVKQSKIDEEKDITQVCCSKTNIRPMTPNIPQQNPLKELFPTMKEVPSNDIKSNKHCKHINCPLKLASTSKSSKSLSRAKNLINHFTKSKNTVLKKKQKNFIRKFECPKLSRSLPVGLNSYNVPNLRTKDKEENKNIVKKLVLDAMEIIFEQNQELGSVKKSNCHFDGSQKSKDNVSNIYGHKEIVRLPSFVDLYMQKSYRSMVEKRNLDSGDNLSTMLLTKVSRKQLENEAKLIEQTKTQILNDIVLRLIRLEQKFDNRLLNIRPTGTNLIKHSSVQCNFGSLECIKNASIRSLNIANIEKNCKEFENIKKKSENISLIGDISKTRILKTGTEIGLLWDGELIDSSFDLKQKIDEIISEKFNQWKNESELNIKEKKVESNANIIVPELNLNRYSVNRETSYENLLLHPGQKSQRIHSCSCSNCEFIVTPSQVQISQSKNVEVSLNESLFSIKVCADSKNKLTPEKNISLAQKISKFVSSISLKKKSSKVSTHDQRTSRNRLPKFSKFWKRKQHQFFYTNSSQTTTNDSHSKANTARSFFYANQNNVKIDSETSNIFESHETSSRMFTSTRKSSFEDTQRTTFSSNISKFSNESFDVKVEYVKKNSQFTSNDMTCNTIYVPSYTCNNHQECTLQKEGLGNENPEKFEYDELIKIYEKKANNNQFFVKRDISSHEKIDDNFVKLYDFLTSANDPDNYKILNSLYRKMIDNIKPEVYVEEQVVLLKKKNCCSSKISVQSDDSINVTITLSELRSLIEDSEVRRFLK